MNANPRPRLVCRVARLWHSTPGSGSSGHVATCADCRRYFGACDELDAGLRGEAKALEADAPTGLENRIMRAIAAEAHADRTPARSAAIPRFALAAGAAAAITLAIGFGRWWPQRTDQAADIDPSREIASLADAAETFSDEWLNTKLPEAGAAAVDNPLRQELDSVYVDARSALDFLALNFLPTTQANAATTRNGKG